MNKVGPSAIGLIQFALFITMSLAATHWSILPIATLSWRRKLLLNFLTPLPGPAGVPNQPPPARAKPNPP